jgi:hypothetical protein
MPNLIIILVFNKIDIFSAKHWSKSIVIITLTPGIDVMILRKNFANNLAEMLGIFFTKNTPFK